MGIGCAAVNQLFDDLKVGWIGFYYAWSGPVKEHRDADMLMSMSRRM
ncbi:hypothetical protein VNPA141818_63570 [Pseudomonas aeruginosa]|nr:hypothetical protein VNPA141818_63570 [Pseudomonas aeruginosa]